MPIRKLSPLLVNQIAAGEAIERPASVVKELVENSLDAGATRIDVQVEDGGRELIRIADDGCGIPLDQIELALEAHATSKIAEAIDLEAIATMGFRGEALASIASVSRLRLSSRTPDSPEGAVIEQAGDQRVGVKPIGMAPGTVIEVRNLFFNTPARRKFMRAASTEVGHINDTLGRLAMAHPDVGFKMTHNDRVTFDYPPGQTPRRRCVDRLGHEIEEGLLEFESDERGVRLWGLAGRPVLARPTAKHQYIYVNDRPVRDRTVMYAVKEAYRGLIEPNLQPMVVLFINVDPTMVDVNVHPTKSEVRFADTNAVRGQVLAVIRQALLATDLTPSIAVGQRGPGGAFNKPAGINPADLFIDTATGEQSTDDETKSRQFVEYFKRMDPKQKGFVYQQVKQDAVEAGIARDEPRNGNGAHDEEDEKLNEGIRASSKPILQVHDSYIVTQDEQGIVIIDQHALHERMMFELLIERVRSSGSLESQRMLTPATFKATDAQIEALDTIGPLLEKIGVDAQPLGPNTIAVHAYPTLLFDRGADPVAFMTDLLDRCTDDNFIPSDEAALHEVLDMMSCKAAIKAGDHLRDDELAELLRRRDQIDRSSNCPHGRPTTIRLTLKDLEKHFKRS
ncbi:MAG: DNA mismatch repair endonuclease MutL [Phycisphaera sp.]|nr:DNA mismatch repair endonuclease MutL [Phycisphaera sp.]